MNRAWCAKVKYPGLKEFILGTVVLDARATHQEVCRALSELWADFSPHPEPSIEPIPGALFFQPEETDNG